VRRNFATQTKEGAIVCKVLFPLGQTVATPGALAALEEANVSPTSLLARHHQGDWGEFCSEDAQANHRALEEGSRIFSSYHVGARKVWVITEADRMATTVLLPQDY
jgi:hypothetical protein